MRVQVHLVPIKCEKYRLKTGILDENSKFPIYFSGLLSFVLSFFDNIDGNLIYILQCRDLEVIYWCV